jgi:hypothetical protein
VISEWEVKDVIVRTEERSAIQWKATMCFRRRYDEMISVVCVVTEYVQRAFEDQDREMGRIAEE